MHQPRKKVSAMSLNITANVADWQGSQNSSSTDNVVNQPCRVLNFSDAPKQSWSGEPALEHGAATSLDQIKQMLRDDISQLVDYLFVGEKLTIRTAREVRYGARGSMQIIISGPGRGNFHNHESGEYGSALDLIAHVNRTGFPEAVSWARDWLGITDDKPRIHRRSQAEIEALKEKERAEAKALRAKAVAKGLKFYEDSKVHSAGSAAGAARGKAYFQFRQLRPLDDLSGVLMGQDRSGYCLVFPAANAAGEVTGVQRIYLTQRGTKAKVGPGGDSKLSLGHMWGSAWCARVSGTPNVSGVACVTEGPEDAITVAQFAGLPCYAAFGVQNIGAVPIPEGNRVIVVRDTNAADSEAYRRTNRAVQELRGRGYLVAEVYPPEGYSDVNELLQREGPDSIWPLFAPLFQGPEAGGGSDPTAETVDPEAIHAESGAELAVHLTSALKSFMGKTADWLEWHRVWTDVEGGPERPDTPKTQVVAAAGGGKTTRTARELIESRVITKNADSPRVDVIVPTNVTQEEFATSLRTHMDAAGITHEIVVIAGRKPDNCQRLADMSDSKAGADQAKGILTAFALKEEAFASAACKKTVRRPNENGFPVPEEITCPHYDECPYIKQFQKLRPAGAVGVFTHPYLMIPAMYGERAAEVVIVDEQTLQTGFETRSIKISAFNDADRNYNAAQYIPQALTARDRSELIGDRFDRVEHAAWVRVALRAITSGRPILSELRTVGFDVHRMTLLRETERQSLAHTHDLDPSMSTNELASRIENRRKNAMHDAWRLWDALAKELSVERDDCIAVKFIPEFTDGKGRVYEDHVVFHHKDSYTRTKGAATLVLDADGTPELGRAIYGPGMTTHRISAERAAHVRQCLETEASESYLLGKGGDASPDADVRARNVEGGRRARQRAYDIACDVHRNGTGNTLFVCSKNVRDAIESEQGQGIPPGLVLAHFGDIRGSNAYEKFGQVVVLGRNQPPSKAMSDIARAIFCRDIELISSGTEYRESKIVATNGVERTTRYLVMSDPRAQQIMEIYREKESLQAIDRLRLIHQAQDNPKHVTVISNLPLPGLSVDEFFDWQEGRRGRQVANANRAARTDECATQILKFTGGVLPLSPAMLVELAPEQLGYADSPSRAKDHSRIWRDRAGLECPDGGRSEERRVGKECRSRWSPYH